MERVDILTIPDFKKSWIVKTRDQAIQDWDWIWTFTLSIIREAMASGLVSILYQVRSPKSWWEPWKLDVAVWWHYQAWEGLEWGLREAKEELWKDYNLNNIIYAGRRLNVSLDTKWRRRNNVVDVSFLVDNSYLNTFFLNESEVYGLCECPINELLRAHQEDYSFDIEVLKHDWTKENKSVSRDSFPQSRDDFHHKVILLADRFVKWDKNLKY